MKKFLLCFTALLIIGSQAKAQDIPVQQQYSAQQGLSSPYAMPYNGKLSLSNKSFLVRVDDYAGNKVSENTLESLLNGDELGRFRGMKVMSNIGRITSLVGAPILGTGIGLALGKLISGGGQSPSATSTMLMIIGTSVMLPGIVIGLVGDGRIRNVLDDYNRRNGYVYTPTIKAGFTPYGMGLTYNF